MGGVREGNGMVKEGEERAGKEGRRKRDGGWKGSESGDDCGSRERRLDEEMEERETKNNGGVRGRGGGRDKRGGWGSGVEEIG